MDYLLLGRSYVVQLPSDAKFLSRNVLACICHGQKEWKFAECRRLQAFMQSAALTYSRTCECFVNFAGVVIVIGVHFARDISRAWIARHNQRRT